MYLVIMPPSSDRAQQVYRFYQVETEYVVVCEGPVDVIGVNRALGTSAAVATYGKKVSDAPLRTLRRRLLNVLS